MNNLLPIKIGVSSCQYFLDSGLIKLHGWLIPSKFHDSLNFYYNDINVTKLVKNSIRLDVQKSFPDYNDGNSGWASEYFTYAIDKSISEYLQARVEVNGEVIFKNDIKIIFVKASYDEASLNKLINNENYICATGSIEVRKNYNILYLVWKKLISKLGSQTPKLLIIGSRGYLSEELIERIQSDPETKSNIIILSNINNSIRDSIIDHSLFTIYPSYFEGWGLPVAESLSRGKMCIASNSTSIPEIASDLIPYFNPYDTQECFEKVLHYIQSPQEVTNVEDRIHQNFKTTSWEDSAFNICKSVNKIL